MQYFWRLLWDYKWRIVTEQIFFCLVAFLAILLGNQLSYRMDIYFGVSLALFALKGRASLIGLFCGGVLGTALLNPILKDWLIAGITPIQASLVFHYLLKRRGPSLPLIEGRTYLNLSVLIMISNGIVQLLLYFLGEQPRFLFLSSQLLNGILWLCLFSHWDSYIPNQSTDIIDRQQLIYLGILFISCLLMLLLNHTGLEWIPFLISLILLWKGRKRPFLMQVAGLLILNLTLSLWTITAGFSSMILLASWGWIGYALLCNQRERLK